MNQPSSIQPSAIHRLFVRQPITSIDIQRDEAVLHTKEGDVRVDLSAAKVVSSKSWASTTLQLETNAGTFTLRGLPATAIKNIEDAIADATRRKALVAQLVAETGSVEVLRRAWNDLAARKAYITASQADRWLASTPPLTTLSEQDADLIAKLPEREQKKRAVLDPMRADPRLAAERRNAEYVEELLETYNAFFDTVERFPLTDLQRAAIVHDEDNALVLACAGTGKTTTIVGKAGFILQMGWAKPEEILVLAYSARAAQELSVRLATRLGVSVPVRTFHTLSHEIIAAATGNRPKVCAEAEDPATKAATLRNIVSGLISDDAFRRRFLELQSTLPFPYKPESEFKSRSEYMLYVSNLDLRTMKGHRVKSYEECEIANWLFFNGIAYEYTPGEGDALAADRAPHPPTFTLTDKSVALDHWETDRSGVLLDRLDAKLREQGIVPRPFSAATALAALNTAGRIDSFVDVAGTFLSLYKSSGLTVEALTEKVAATGNPRRGEVFLALFQDVLKAYEAHIHRDGDIDYEDLTAMAAGYVQSGRYRSRFRYALIDDFQDTTRAQANLILALRKQAAGDLKLFAAADDWQSIGRSSGSDISLTTGIAETFGYTRQTALDTTFRFHNKIADFGSRFVLANPAQLQKIQSTPMMSDIPGVWIWFGRSGQNPLMDVLDDINQINAGASVFILARHQNSLPGDLDDIRARFRRMKIQAMTIRAAKGMEAEYVIILGLDRGRYGFPSETGEDPVLSLVLPEGEAFRYAEERRQFYVALTRATKRVHLIADSAKPSPFIMEVLRDDEYAKKLMGRPDVMPGVPSRPSTPPKIGPSEFVINSPSA